MLTRAKKARLELESLPGKLTEETRKPPAGKLFNANEPFNTKRHNTRELERSPQATGV